MVELRASGGLHRSKKPEWSAGGMKRNQEIKNLQWEKASLLGYRVLKISSKSSKNMLIKKMLPTRNVNCHKGKIIKNNYGWRWFALLQWCQGYLLKKMITEVLLLAFTLPWCHNFCHMVAILTYKKGDCRFRTYVKQGWVLCRYFWYPKRSFWAAGKMRMSEGCYHQR